jgi:hypothetical protein
MHGHDVSAARLAIGPSSSTVAVATRQEEQRDVDHFYVYGMQGFTASSREGANDPPARRTGSPAGVWHARDGATYRLGDKFG